MRLNKPNISLLSGLLPFKRDEMQQKHSKFELLNLQNIFMYKHENLTIELTYCTL